MPMMNAGNATATAPDATTTNMLTINTVNCSVLALTVSNANATNVALDAFQVRMADQPGATAAIVSSATGDFTGPIFPQLRPTISALTLPYATSISLRMDVRGISSVEIWASGASATVDLSFTWQTYAEYSPR